MIFPATRDGLMLGLGGAPVGNMYSAITDDAAQALLQAVYADGCVSFDTAPHYGNGRSEQRYGRLLSGVPRDSFVVSTKVGRLLTPDANAPRDHGAYVDVLPNVQHFDYSRAGVRRSIEDSLVRLGIARIDVAYVHDCSVMTHGDKAPAVVRQVITESIPELQGMRREGLIRHIGVAVSHWQTCIDILREAELDCLLLAGRYTASGNCSAAVPAGPSGHRAGAGRRQIRCALAGCGCQIASSDSRRILAGVAQRRADTRRRTDALIESRGESRFDGYPP